MQHTRSLTLPRSPLPEEVFALLRNEPGAVWLDDGRAKSGWTIIGWKPERISTIGSNWPAKGRELTGSGTASDIPFTTGCIGYIGYHAAHHTTPVPVKTGCPEPEVWLAHYAQSLCYRHADQQWYVTGSRTHQDDAERLLNAAIPLKTPRPATPLPSQCDWEANDYKQAIHRILQLLHDGDCYQINLSRPVRVNGHLDPWECYRRLRRASSASHGALLNLGDSLRMLSSSPELLLGVDGHKAQSIPIKGTRPRGCSQTEDRALIRELDLSPKGGPS